MSKIISKNIFATGKFVGNVAKVTSRAVIGKNGPTTVTDINLAFHMDGKEAALYPQTARVQIDNTGRATVFAKYTVWDEAAQRAQLLTKGEFVKCEGELFIQQEEGKNGVVYNNVCFKKAPKKIPTELMEYLAGKISGDDSDDDILPDGMSLKA